MLTLLGLYGGPKYIEWHEMKMIHEIKWKYFKLPSDNTFIINDRNLQYPKFIKKWNKINTGLNKHKQIVMTRCVVNNYAIDREDYIRY